jgi:hypothetical protein
MVAQLVEMKVVEMVVQMVGWKVAQKVESSAA